MNDDFASSKPIYMQLMDRVCEQIVRGEHSPGDKLPSVRDMAVQVGVNPNTVQRVYMELERMYIAETRRGQGTFVTGDLARIGTLREEMLRERISSFMAAMRDMGMRPDEILRGVEEHIRESETTE